MWNLCALVFTRIEKITKLFPGNGRGVDMLKLFSMKRSQEVSDFRNSKILFFMEKSLSPAINA